jgi:hypothetical protein
VKGQGRSCDGEDVVKKVEGELEKVGRKALEERGISPVWIRMHSKSNCHNYALLVAKDYRDHMIYVEIERT